MIAVIDYNAGNLASLTNALDRLNFEYTVTRDPKIILSADKVIFPGQGRAGPAMADLKKDGLDKILKQVRAPFLGICLGMQLLMEHSAEDDTECLGIIEGKVKKFPATVKTPQIGWNTITRTHCGPLFRGLPEVMDVYFANSYFVETNRHNIFSFSHYGDTKFASVVRQNNFFGAQFHPEKSGRLGIRLLKNFCELFLDYPAVKGKIDISLYVLPAIDLLGGKCVRLSQGDYEHPTIYGENPLNVIQTYTDAGASGIHLIDLDGAKQGSLINKDAILNLIDESKIPLQVGGGIRSLEHARLYLDGGAQRIILSTAAINQPEMVKQLVKEYGPNRVMVSIDGKDGRVMVKGWAEETGITIYDLLWRMDDLEITNIIYTDIRRDGMLKGPNFEVLRRVLQMPFRITVAGGISSVADAEKLRDLGATGIIIGKALYENRINLKEVVSAVNGMPLLRERLIPRNNVTKRVIACMDIANGRVVKGAHFQNLRDAGDPVELGRLYSDQGIDELIFLDINATIENRQTLYSLVARIAKEINIPFAVGGGVKTLADIKNLLNNGADKVSLGSIAVSNPQFVATAAKEFGAQCVTISVDPKWNGKFWEIYIKGGREATGIDAIEFAKKMENLGAGELLVNSLDRDGTKNGYDIKLLNAIVDAVNIPIIASSGAGKKEDFLEAFTAGRCDAALAATLFHDGEIYIPELKEYLRKQNLMIRN